MSIKFFGLAQQKTPARVFFGVAPTGRMQNSSRPLARERLIGRSVELISKIIARENYPLPLILRGRRSARLPAADLGEGVPMAQGLVVATSQTCGMQV